jgi:hypothetical protein
MSRPINPNPISPVLTLKGLTEEDAAEINEILAKNPDAASDIRLVEEVLPAHKLGEPATFFLLATATMAGIGVLGAFLMKKRKTLDVHVSVAVQNPDGSRSSERIDISQSDSEAPPADVIEKLSSITKLSSEQIKGLLQ